VNTRAFEELKHKFSSVLSDLYVMQERGLIDSVKNKNFKIGYTFGSSGVYFGNSMFAGIGQDTGHVRIFSVLNRTLPVRFERSLDRGEMRILSSLVSARSTEDLTINGLKIDIDKRIFNVFPPIKHIAELFR